MKLLDDLIKYVPLGSVSIIILSYLKQSLFYNEFNIDIINYISLTEFIILFLKDSFLIATILIVVLVIFLMKENFRFIYKKLMKRKKIVIILISLTVLIIVIYKIRGTISSLDNNRTNFGFIVLLFTLFTMLFSYYIITKFFKDDITLKTQLIIGTGFAFIFISSYSKLTAYRFKNDLVNIFYEIKQENELIKTNTNLIRLGQTEKYFFLYDRQKETSSIIKTDDISEIKIYKKR